MLEAWILFGFCTLLLGAIVEFFVIHNRAKKAQIERLEASEFLAEQAHVFTNGGDLEFFSKGNFSTENAFEFSSTIETFYPLEKAYLSIVYGEKEPIVLNRCATRLKGGFRE